MQLLLFFPTSKGIEYAGSILENNFIIYSPKFQSIPLYRGRYITPKNNKTPHEEQAASGEVLQTHGTTGAQIHKGKPLKDIYFVSFCFVLTDSIVYFLFYDQK